MEETPQHATPMHVVRWKWDWFGCTGIAWAVLVVVTGVASDVLETAPTGRAAGFLQKRPGGLIG